MTYDDSQSGSTRSEESPRSYGLRAQGSFEASSTANGPIVARTPPHSSAHRMAAGVGGESDDAVAPKGALGAVGALSKLTILVVEDDPDARELLQAVLEQHGAHVLPADSVARALELLEALRPNLIISDIGMPVEDGIAFVKKLRSRSPDAGGTTPAIAVSAFVAASDRTRALSAGFTHYLHKPVDFAQLSRAIHACTEDVGDRQL